ncbi:MULTISPECIES: hypothetical protein [Burkholderia cepacia complex]|uniref:hypothetical protein n=1 Tax=Burkholderia cepacia complex TaxID=87882 RepID=UPI001B97241C|nr:MULTISPECIES: hypothetical protein [Burkholderia cepacia complex]MBR8402682.1 hypothetical protein [Burkholderia cenocepacia]MDN7643675.1 hypothetical protein [Burkholderia cenocepacia]WJN72855.1 hypothetical protein OH687_21360 [Burkholderia anthina]
MKHIENKNVRLVLLDFAKLTGAERREFLDAMNEFLFSSPQRQRAIMKGWEQHDSAAPAASIARAQRPDTASNSDQSI